MEYVELVLEMKELLKVLPRPTKYHFDTIKENLIFKFVDSKKLNSKMSNISPLVIII